MNPVNGLLLGIAIVPVYNASVLAVADVSSYPPGFTPVGSFLEVTAPGFEKQVLAFTAGQINIYNSRTLDLTAETAPVAPLPDGVWKLKYSVRPNYERFVEKVFMRLDQILEQFDSAVLKADLSAGGCCQPDKGKKELDIVEFYLQAAMAAANKCNEKLAIDYYRKAKKMLDKTAC